MRRWGLPPYQGKDSDLIPTRRNHPGHPESRQPGFFHSTAIYQRGDIYGADCHRHGRLFSRAGRNIGGLDKVSQDAMVFRGRTRRQDSQPVTARGRVPGVTAVGRTMTEARARAYAGVGVIRFEGARWRTDIASGMDAPGEGEQI